MDLENIILSERSQHRRPNIVLFHLYEEPRKSKYQGLQQSGKTELLFSKYGFWGGDKNCLDTNNNNSYTTL